MKRALRKTLLFAVIYVFCLIGGVTLATLGGTPVASLPTIDSATG